MFQGKAELLNCQTIMGEITVLDNHQPYITVLKEGTVKIVDNNKKEKHLPIKSGFLEIKKNNQVRCLVDG